MTEVVGDIWAYHRKGHIIVVTTNGTIKNDGRAVMGAGVARQALDRYRELDRFLGHSLKTQGNHVFYFPDKRILTLPVKHNWWETADLELIDRSLDELLRIAPKSDKEICMTRPGCGNGGLDWQDVMPLLLGRIRNDYIIVDHAKPL